MALKTISTWNRGCKEAECGPAQALDQSFAQAYVLHLIWQCYHKQGQRDVENYLHIPLAHCGSSTKPTNIFVGFWLLCIKIVK